MFHVCGIKVVVWRRYNDFKKLYKAMLSLHQALHRKEEFPPFAKGKVFGTRFLKFNVFQTLLVVFYAVLKCILSLCMFLPLTICTTLCSVV